MKTVLKLYARVLGQPMLLLKLGGLMMVILIGYRLAFVVMLRLLISPDDQSSALQRYNDNIQFLIAGFLIYAFLYAWLIIVFSVRWHRYALLGFQNYRFLSTGFGTRGRRFAWKSILIMLVLFLVGTLYFLCSIIILQLLNAIILVSVESRDILHFDFEFSFFLSGPSAIFDAVQIQGIAIIDQFPFIPMALRTLFFLVCAYIVARSSLVYPAITLGFAMRIRDSWHETRGHGLRITALLIVMSLPALIGSELAVHIELIGNLPRWVNVGVIAFVQSLFLLITTALWASTFSHAYKALDLPLHPPQWHPS